MIPEFPNFKLLEVTDRVDIQKHTMLYPPYSDFNFTSMWCWNIENEITISLLNNNLIVKFSDYITRKNFYSFLGINLINETIEKLIQFAKKKGEKSELRLIGEAIALQIDTNKFVVKEDPDNFDYILLISSLITYSGNSLRGKRNFVHRFNKLYRAETILLDIFEPDNKKNILERFFIWADQKNLSIDETRNEFTAISRLLDKRLEAQLLGVGVFVDKKLVGFSISEVVDSEYALLHFEKCDFASYVGVYPYVMQKTADVLIRKGCRYLNYEQDLGMPGLRKAKLSYSPFKMLKKQVITQVEK